MAAEGETTSTGDGDTGTIDYLSSSTAAFTAAGISASAGPSGFAVPGSIMWDMKDNISNSDEIKDWLTSNENLYHFLFLSTTGPAASYLLQFNPEEGMLPDGIAAWKGLISKYKNSTRQRKILLQKELTYRVMPEGQDPDVFFQELFSVRNELKTMGRIVDDDEILGIILNGLPEEYSQVKLLAESQNDFDLIAAMDTMRNMYGNRDAANGLPRIAKGRSSAMTATASTKFCSFCRKKGHTVEECWRKNKLPAEQDPGGRNGDWCTLHKTTRHDNSNCREQQGQHTNKASTPAAAVASEVASSTDATKVISPTATGTTTGISKAETTATSTATTTATPTHQLDTTSNAPLTRPKRTTDKPPLPHLLQQWWTTTTQPGKTLPVRLLPHPLRHLQRESASPSSPTAPPRHQPSP